MVILFVFRELIERAPCESTACTLYKVALNLCEKLAEGDSMVTDKNKNVFDVTHTIHQLLCQASTHCSPGRGKRQKDEVTSDSYHLFIAILSDCSYEFVYNFIQGIALKDEM